METKVISVLNATNILVVFVTVFFTLQYPKIIKVLDSPIPGVEKPKERHKIKKLYQSLIINQWLPVLVLNSIATYIHLPLFFMIISTSSFSIWEFNIVVTAFELIVLFLIGLTIWSFKISVKLFLKYRSL